MSTLLAARSTTMRRNFLIVTGVAFLALVILIGVLAVNGMIQLNHHRQLNTNVVMQNLKVGIVTQIQVASHMRTDSLLRMALIQDPFERDEVYLEFNRAAFLVGSARNELKKILTPAEQIAFNRQTELVIQIQVMQCVIAANSHPPAEQLQPSVGANAHPVSKRDPAGTDQSGSKIRQNLASGHGTEYRRGSDGPDCGLAHAASAITHLPPD